MLEREDNVWEPQSGSQADLFLVRITVICIYLQKGRILVNNAK